MKSLIALAFCWALCCGIASQESHAQNLPATATGKSYIIPFPKPLENLYDTRFPNLQIPETLILLMYADHSTSVVVTPPGGGSEIAIALNGGEFKEVELPVTPASYIDQAGIVSHNAYRVKARNPILLYCYMTDKFGGEAWAPLPVESWGHEYYTAAIADETIADLTLYSEFSITSDKKGAPSQIIITAARNNTEVIIEPKAAVAGGATAPIMVRLNAGESYMVRSESDTSAPGNYDLGGTRILANKIISVISGNTRASALPGSVMLTGNSARNLLVEALAPIEQHGTEFVEMPTWDDRRLRPGLAQDESRQHEYTRIYGSSDGTTYGTITDDEGSLDPFSVMETDVNTRQFTAAVPHLIRTDQPAQAMMHPEAVVKYNGTTTYGPYIGAAYQSWGSYMVELTPREQWTNRGAFTVPSKPSGMHHYINLVTRDDDQVNVYISQNNGTPVPFLFNKGSVPGSNLVWGTIAVSPETTYIIEGRDGARFGGFAYGLMRGQETYRPGATKKDDKGTGIQSAHPSEYEEVLGMAYGYPLTPRRRVLNDPDFLSISTVKNVNGYETYNISTTNAKPVGLRSVELAPGSVNAELEFVDMEDETDIVEATKATVRIHPIDLSRDARATLVVTDRTGNETTLPYEYSVELSGVTTGDQAVDRIEVVGPNPTPSETGILIGLTRGVDMRVTIVNALGQEIAVLTDGPMKQGEHVLEWNASNVPAGMYFCLVTGPEGNTMRRIVVR